ncbi:AraC family transcriptional regulator [Enterococcus sp. AZ196]|uniref:AraC family transcriptional regulator n=1 Tax=Enterococcus sp. AZ196 TaxID=2774659 RepID=UPI003D271F5B
MKDESIFYNVEHIPRIDQTKQSLSPYVIVDPSFDPYRELNHSNEVSLPLKKILKTLELDDSLPFAIVSHYLDLPSNLHHHDYIEIVYVPKGKLLNVVNHSPFIMKSGSLFLINKEIPHLVSRIPNETEKPMIVNLLIHTEIFDTFKKATQQSTTLTEQLFNFGDYLIYHKSDLDNVHYYLQRLITEYYQAEYTFSYTVLGYLMIFLEQLIQLQHPLKKSVDTLTQNVVTKIKQDPANASLEVLTKHFSYSKGHLSRHIKEQTGKTISQLITDEKLALAERYLSETTKTISEISEMINYQSESHFYRLFKKRFQLTPKQYRLLLK